MKEQLIKKFIQAFNAGYPTQLPSITLTDVDDPEEPSKEIFTPLESTLAVLYYQQLCDYLSNYDPNRLEEDHRVEIRQLLKGQAFNETLFDLFERHNWGQRPRLSLVEKSIKDRLDEVHEIKYRLQLVEDERCLLQASLNQLYGCAYSFPAGIVRDKTQPLIEDLQTHFDEYVAHLVKSGIVIPINGLQHLEIEYLAGKDFLEKITGTINRYQNEFFKIESSSKVTPENRSLCQYLMDLLDHFLSLLRRFVMPHPRVSATFFKPEQAIYHHAQKFMQVCKRITVEKPTILKL